MPPGPQAVPDGGGEAVRRLASAWRRLGPWLWRLVAVTPPGRLHERSYRRHLNMGRKHPEHASRPATWAEKRLLGAYVAEMWPDGEWLWLIDEQWKDRQ